MHLSLEDTKEEILAVRKTAKHISPHLHNALEIVYVTDGTLELGVGQELYHMEKGDIGFVFPDIIHHYQVFAEESVNRALYINVSPFLMEKFEPALLEYAPLYPVIRAEEAENEIFRIFDILMGMKQNDFRIVQAYLQMILARCMGKLKLTDKNNMKCYDFIYQTVSYVSANFKKRFTLEDMAGELGISKFALSRVFSGTFHRNFNQYLNDVRINYACSRLENTADTITEIYLDSGFESQRTFNRVFKERFGITPGEYRKRVNYGERHDTIEP